MKSSIRLFFLLAVLPLSAAGSVRADSGCRIGDVCVLQNALFGCKDPSLIKRWIDLYVEQDPDAAEAFVSEETAAGRCARFERGERLILVRYLGIRRLEARRPGDSERFILLLK